MESFLEALYDYQKRRQPFGLVFRQPKFLSLIRSADPCCPLLERRAPLFNIDNDHQFHTLVDEYGEDGAQSRYDEGLWFQTVMHPMAGNNEYSADLIDNAVNPRKPLQRYGNWKTYKKESTVYTEKFDPLADAETWIRNGNPDKEVNPNGDDHTPTIPKPTYQELSEDDDTDNEEQHEVYVDDCNSRILRHHMLFRSHHMAKLGDNVADNAKYNSWIKKLAKAKFGRVQQDAIDYDREMVRKQLAVRFGGRLVGNDEDFSMKLEYGTWLITLGERHFGPTLYPTTNLSRREYTRHAYEFMMQLAANLPGYVWENAEQLTRDFEAGCGNYAVQQNFQ